MNRPPRRGSLFIINLVHQLFNRAVDNEIDYFQESRDAIAQTAAFFSIQRANHASFRLVRSRPITIWLRGAIAFLLLDLTF
ncbi:MAG: hypothetical protein ACTS2F_25015 [Thainema sp.]